MRILVGTLYTIENEFNECIESIKSQSHQDFEHLVIDNLPNKQAHDFLYSTFINRRSEFDLLIKVDADMVIENKDLFKQIVLKFQQTPQMVQLQIAVQDFFTDRLIMGLNSYRNTVVWNSSEEMVFVDSREVLSVPPGGTFRDRTDLAPAAIHCKNPSGFQAFHFGIHKGVKVRQALYSDMSLRSTEHLKNIEDTWRHFLRTGDIRLGWAALGGELALRNDFDIEHLDYSNPFAQQAFAQYKDWDIVQVRNKVARLRLQGGSVFGIERRQILLRHGWCNGLTLLKIARTVPVRMFLGKLRRRIFSSHKTAFEKKKPEKDDL